MNNQDNIQQEYIEWEDHFQTTKEIVHLTYNELKIPGLRLFGMLHPLTASAPLRLHIHSSAFEITFVTQGEMAFYTMVKTIPYRVAVLLSLILMNPTVPTRFHLPQSRSTGSSSISATRKTFCFSARRLPAN